MRTHNGFTLAHMHIHVCMHTPTKHFVVACTDRCIRARRPSNINCELCGGLAHSREHGVRSPNRAKTKWLREPKQEPHQTCHAKRTHGCTSALGARAGSHMRCLLVLACKGWFGKPPGEAVPWICVRKFAHVDSEANRDRTRQSDVYMHAHEFGCRVRSTVCWPCSLMQGRCSEAEPDQCCCGLAYAPAHARSGFRTKPEGVPMMCLQLVCRLIHIRRMDAAATLCCQGGGAERAARAACRTCFPARD